MLGVLALVDLASYWPTDRNHPIRDRDDRSKHTIEKITGRMVSECRRYIFQNISSWIKIYQLILLEEMGKQF